MFTEHPAPSSVSPGVEVRAARRRGARPPGPALGALDGKQPHLFAFSLRPLLGFLTRCGRRVPGTRSALTDSSGETAACASDWRAPGLVAGGEDSFKQLLWMEARQDEVAGYFQSWRGLSSRTETLGAGLGAAWARSEAADAGGREGASGAGSPAPARTLPGPSSLPCETGAVTEPAGSEPVLSRPGVLCPSDISG